MRKTAFIIFLILSVSLASAQEHRQSFGVIGGTLNGISYKLLGKKSPHYAFLFDVYWQWGYLPEGARFDYSVSGTNQAYSEQTYISTFPSTRYQAAMTAFSFMHQGEIPSNGQGTWNWYVGAGVAIGATWGGQLDQAALEFRPRKENLPWLKLDQHAIAGIEYYFGYVPLSLGLDLRPALVENILFKGVGVNRDEVYVVSFDWGINLTFRYHFDY